MDEAIELTLLALVFFSLLGVILYFSLGILEQQR
jgi:Flp pilus assembly protein TadG